MFQHKGPLHHLGLRGIRLFGSLLGLQNALQLTGIDGGLQKDRIAAGLLVVAVATGHNGNGGVAAAGSSTGGLHNGLPSHRGGRGQLIERDGRGGVALLLLLLLLLLFPVLSN